LTGDFFKILGPLQKTVLNSLSNFATAIFNLKLL